MRLITQNMLKCNIKGVENGYPLRIEAITTEIIETPFNSDLVKAMLGKINFECLKSAASDLSIQALHEYQEPSENDENLLRVVHHLLFEIHVIEGNLICPQSGRKFPIHDGIPNMLLHEDEV